MTDDQAAAALAGLDDEQRAVAEAVSGPVVVLAGAGTGKTRAITHRIAHAVAIGAHDPRRTLALTFTTRAAGEMRGRLAQLGVTGVSARTFHSAALRQLRYFWPRVTTNAFPEVLPSKARFVADAARSVGVGVDKAQLRDLVTDIEWAKARDLAPADMRALPHQWSMGVDEVIAAFEAYEQVKIDRGYIDFEDVLSSMAELIESRPDVADTVRTQYRWLTVDEYQDVSPLQHRLLKGWLGDRDDICVVGDVSQTIYSFAGASAQYLLDFEREYPHATAVRLVNCYRCAPPIVARANALVAGRPGALTLRPMQSAAAVKAADPKVTAYSDDVAEAEGVAAQIARLIADGTRPQDIAVLYRMNAQSVELETALAELGIPIAMRGSERFFDRPEVREAVTRLRGAARAAGSTDDGGAADTAPLLTAVGEEARAVLAHAGWTPQPPPTAGAVRERWESLAALVAFVDEIAAARPSATLPDIVAELDERAHAQHAPAAQAVTLASLHSAKGLEWDVVFIVGVSDGLLPLSHAQTPDEVEEERRLLYVGVTRARHVLALSWARARQPGGRASREPSTFLADLDYAPQEQGVLASVKRGSGSRSGDRRRRGPATCRTCGKALVTAAERTLGRCRTCPGTVDEELFERLRQWRLQRAQERSVPAYVVCTDASLQAIVEQRPESIDALLDIPGIGPAKADAYGEELVAILAGWTGGEIEPA